MSASAPVVVRNLNHAYGKGSLRKQVLFDITTEIPAGEIVIVTGPSGSGKTTLLTLIGALRSAQEGSVRVLGEELCGAGPATLEIRDPVRGRVRTVSFDAEAGLHRYRWDLQFDAEPFTAEQVARVEAAFERMMAEAEGFGAQLRRMRDRFRAAQTGEDQRAALRPLLDPETGSGLGEEFAPPVAGPGTYTLRLIAGGASSVSSLTVRADPLLNAPR